MNFKLITRAVCVCLAAVSLNVNAATVFYTDEASFLAAAGMPQATMTYENVIPPGGVITNVFGNYTEDGITQTNLSQIISDTFAGGIYDIGTGDTGQVAPSTVSNFSYSGGSIFAGGATVFTVNSDATHSVNEVSISLSSGLSSFVVTSALAGSSAFIGFISDTAITSFDLFSSDFLEVDNVVVYNNISTVPIPAAAWLFGTGLLGFIGMMKRRKV